MPLERDWDSDRNLAPILVVGDRIAAWVILAAGCHKLQRAVGKWPLQHLGLVPWRPEPDVMFFGCGQDDRHRLRVNAADFGVRLAGQETEDVGSDLAFFGLPDAGPIRP